MLKLPAQTSELREMFDISALVNYRSLPTFRQVVTACRDAAQDVGAVSANGLCLRADGEIWLVQVGKRGAWKRLWNFGNPVQGAA